MSLSTQTVPKVVLKPRRALPFFSRHPWVFGNAVARIEPDDIPPGALVTLVSSKGEFIARGLFNPNSQIRVRLYSWDEADCLDEEFFAARLEAAINLRQELYGPPTDDSACRLVYSEADGLSGLIVDRYGDWLVVQFTSLALYERREMLIDLLSQQLRPSGIWLRTEKGVLESEGLTLSDGLLAGTEPPRPMFIEEHGIRYGIDLVEGQKTGFYLDQRENRLAVSRYLRGHRVLDMFCYSGGFSLAAIMKGNAKEVRAFDISESALHLARANAELNGVAPRIRFEKSNAYQALEQLAGEGEQFDTVMLDPPKLTRRRAGISQALKGYFSLNSLALGVLKPGGTLVSCSCSGLLGKSDFEQMLASVSLKSGRRIQILESRGAAPDHPTSVHCLENNYLKCAVCRVL